MGSLSNLYISQSYQSLTHLGTNNALVPGTMTQLQDGIGQSLNISFDGTNISSSGNIFAANITGSGASINTGSFATTASFNSYTASTNIRLNNLELNTGSVNISISNLNLATSSLNSSVTQLNANTASQQLQINSLINATGSYVTSAITASSLVTASVNLNTITFTKGNGTTFNITVNTGSGGGGTTDISSLNAFTASQDTKNATLATYTASVDQKFSNIGGQSGSWITESETASFARTDVNNNFSVNQTFTNITAVSASFQYVQTTYETSSIIYSSGSNQLGDAIDDTQTLIGLVRISGSQQTTGSVGIDGNVTLANSSVLTLGTIKSATSQGLAFSSSAGLAVARFGAGGGQQAEFLGQVTAVGAISASSFTGLGNLTTYSTSVDARLDSLEALTSSIVPITSLNTFTQSILGTNPWTASIDAKFATIGGQSGSWGGSTINTGSFATTGSNTFIGNQTLQDAASNASTIVPTSGSLMLVAKSYTSASSHMTASANLVNLIFKNNNNTGDTIISGSNNIFVNQSAATTDFKRYIGGNGNIAPGPTHIPQISSSMGFSPVMNNNFLNVANGITMRGPVSSSTWTISQNTIQGLFNIGIAAATNAEKIVSGLTATNNTVIGSLNLIANSNNLATLVTLTNNNINGTATLILASSSVTFTNTIIGDSAFTFNNNYYTGSAGTGLVTAQRNTIVGNTNTITFQGAQQAGITSQPQLNDNFIAGANNTIFSDVSTTRISGANNYSNFYKSIVAGFQLIVSASSAASDTTNHGSAFFGRFAANDGIRNKSSDTVFSVGTGTTTALRKTGFLIDSGSNTFVEGSLNVSGSSSFTGSVNGNVVSMSITSNTASMNFNLGNYFELTASVSPVRIEVSNLSAGTTKTLSVSGSTASTITFSPNVQQPSGSLYTASVSGQTDILSFVAFNSSKVNVVSTLKMV